MKRDFLEKFNLEKEVIDEIMAENGKDITREQNRKSALQSKYDDLKEAYDKVKDVDVDKLTKEMNEWKEKFETLDNQVATEKANAEFNEFLKGSFDKFKVKDEISVKAHLDLDKLKGLEGEEKQKELDNQLSSIQESSNYLFEPTETENNNNMYTYTPARGGGNTDNSLEKALEQAINGF